MSDNLSKTTTRLIKGSVEIAQNPPEKNQVSYQHKVLAQTSFPYRDPGKDVNEWIRYGHDTALIIRSLKVVNARTKKEMLPGLPYGAKSRLLMIYINEQAVIQDSPVIDIEESMTAFLKEVHGKPLDGRQIKQYKNQITRISSCDFSISVALSDDQTLNDGGRIIRKFDVWFPKDPDQKVLWTSKIQLSDEYFQTLKKFLVPLDKRAVGNLSHSAMGLDIYTWLAQRLHHISEDQEQFVSWQNLKEQFGEGYKDMFNFKRVFRHTLTMVLSQYPQAQRRVTEQNNKGYWLKRAAPPVPYRKSENRQITG